MKATTRPELTLVCANPDIVVQRGDRLIPCGGALAQLYAALGGEVIMAGKPHAIIYDAALREAEREGPEAISIKALAKQIGVSQPAPYRHFADRRALLAAVAADGFDGAELFQVLHRRRV